MADDLVSPETTVQDFRNKTLGPLERGTPGAPISPSPQFDSPGLPTSYGAGLRYNERLTDTAAQASAGHSSLMSTIYKQKAAQRAAQGRGSTGATSRVLGQAATAAGMSSAGGGGGAYGLQKNAAAALALMQGAYQQKWGQPLTVISGGRSREEQAHLYSLYKQGRGNLAAPPGTSVHESGRAVDFGGAAHGFTPQQSWLASVAGQYGFSWTGRTFSQVEPWHFEYVGA